jgi:rare lipoprotein A (peptidoglycan hydrolase)
MDAARGLAAALVAAAALTLVPSSAQARPAAPVSGDLAQLTAQLARATARAEALSAQLDQAAARDGGLRVAYARLDDVRYEAQVALDTRAREVYMASAPVPVTNVTVDFAAPTLQMYARRGQRSALTVDQELVEAVTAQAAQIKALEKQAESFRLRLLGQAKAVLAEQDRARVLLAEATALAQAQQAAEALKALEAQRAALDTVSAAVTVALTPAQSRRSQRAQAREAPIVALLESAGSSIPPGYARTGQVFAGGASWYGPGFVGKPTASGAPYDPERATCAHKTLPLGTVLHVTSRGLAVNCLVNDRGPYIDGRILDMSRAGSRALGYDGVAQVVIEVLQPV